MDDAVDALPPGGRTEWLTAGDGTRLRTMRWDAVIEEPRGSVVLLNGRTEFIEKYCEVIRELLERRFAVFTLDWRGQGLSSRALSDPLRGDVADFAQFDEDLRLFMERVVYPQAPRPLIALAHSMGGNILLRFLHREPKAFSCSVLTAPMLAIKTAPFPAWFARSVARMQVMAGAGTAYIWGGGPDAWTHPFEGNVVTTDRRRYARAEALLRAQPALRLASPSFRWLSAAFDSMAWTRQADFAGAIETPVLLVGAARDKIVHPGADMRLIRRLKKGTFVLLDAEHEIMMERDEIRRLFWAFFDGFVARGS
ncbi:MAG TPA: alpha/beta hydrolase [Alphaproteobacteria bacterium]|nr:alpha/beta hydrolase [Alphaproteobacteria bacterium]